MSFSFNLLKEPWLPCLDGQNKRVNINLVDAITNAHKIKEIQGEYPIITGSLFLFLIAFMMNILKLEDEEDWERLWKQGQFPQREVDSYANEWLDRFDLFDPIHPFYQDPKIGLREKDIRNLKDGKTPEPKGVSGLILHIASGNNATLFDHSLDQFQKDYSASQAAQLLISFQAYSLGGMSSASIAKDRYYKDAPFGRGVLFLGRGENLFETLMLNIPSSSFNGRIEKKESNVCWEQEDPFAADRELPDGMLDFLTWQSRRLLLIPEDLDGDLRISSLYTAPGHGLVETFTNPYYHNRIVPGEKSPSIKPLRFQEGRSLWRDSGAILDSRSSNYESALPISWMQYLETNEILIKNTIHLDLYGMCTQPGQKKTYFYTHETFSAPVEYLADHQLLNDLQNGLGLAEQVRSDLYIAVRELARFKVAPMHDLDNTRIPGREDTDPLMQHWNAEHKYWSNLETPFYEFINTLLNTESAIETWMKSLRESARNALAYAAEQVGTDPAGLKARAKAERTLNFRLYQTFNPERKE